VRDGRSSPIDTVKPSSIRQLNQKPAVRSATRRDPADAVRVGLGVGLLVWSWITVSSADPSTIEVNLFRLINQLPGAVGAPLIGLMQLGALAAVPVIAVVCVLEHRGRLARLLVVGGGAAWVVAKALAQVAGQRPPDERISGVLLHGAVTPGLAFPSTHVAVAAALATIASPYLGRSGRRSAWLLVAAVGVARIYVGAHLPVDVVGGFAVGWIVGSVVHLMLGAPRGLPDPRALLARLALIGRPMASVETVAGAADCFRLVDRDGTVLHLRVADRDRREADWLYRAWRLVAFRDPGDIEHRRSPAHDIEHEALALMLAGRAAVPVPDVAWTAPLAEGEVVLARRWLGGQPLDRVATQDGAALATAWRTLRSLHTAGLAHGNADLAAFVVGPDTVSCINLCHARLEPTVDDQRSDIATLLASSAAAIGPTAAVRVAKEVLGGSALLDVLPRIEPLALPSTTRAALRRSPRALEELRAAVAGLGTEPAPPMERPLRVATRNLGLLLLGVIAVVLLVTQTGSLHAALTAASKADVTWLALAALCTVVGYVMAAVALMGASPTPLALGRTTIAQFAAAFTNRLAPAGLGAIATNVRYLERAGARRTQALQAVGVNAGAGLVVHTVLLATLVPLVGLQARLRLPAAPDLDVIWPIAGVIVVALSAVGVVYWRHRLVRFWSVMWPGAELRDILRHPKRALLLFGGSAGLTLAQGCVLVASLEAFGVHLPVVTVLAVFVASSAVAAAAPTPGGLGALEAALVGLLAKVGAPSTPAIAAVLSARLIGYWLPALPGWLAFTQLRRRQEL